MYIPPELYQPPLKEGQGAENAEPLNAKILAGAGIGLLAITGLFTALTFTIEKAMQESCKDNPPAAADNTGKFYTREKCAELKLGK